MSRARRFISLLVLCVGVGVGAPAVHADFWYEHYSRAENALEREDWQAAITQLQAAVEKKQDSSPNARTYGVNTVTYFPYYKMGVAYYELGKLDSALQAFDTEVALAQIQKSRPAFDNLQRLQGLIAAAEEAERERQAQVIRELVAENLDAAERLEGEGKLEEAIEAANRALAVDQENTRSREILSRLRGAIAQRDERRQLEVRVAELADRGRGFLGEGRYQEAASAFTQAHSLLPNDDMQRLIEEAQSKLRAEIQAREGEAQRVQLVADGLAEATRLAGVGSFDDAVRALQTVLALEPDNARALNLQRRIGEQQLLAEEQSARSSALDGFLAQALEDMEGNRTEQALLALNRALAIDPSNEQAMAIIGRAFGSLNETLLDAPGIIRFRGVRNTEVGPVLIETVEDARYQLLGKVIDNLPTKRVAVRLAHYGCTGLLTCVRPSTGLESSVAAFSDTPEGSYDEDAAPIAEASVGDDSLDTGELVRAGDLSLEFTDLGDVVLTEFAFQHSLSSGLSVFQVRTTDPNGKTSQNEYAVWYAAPFYRARWFYSLVAIGMVAMAGGVWLQRARRRKKLLERRFNPYVAGAPILQDDGYYGRDRLMHRVMQSIHNNSILLYGERRIGKTSFQHRLRNRLLAVDDPEFQFYPVYIDLQGTPQERFFSTLGEEIFEELGPILDGVKPNEKLSKGEAYTHRELTRDLRAVLKVLRAKSEKTPKLVLQIDEVDELNDYDPRVNQRLRSLFMKSFAENLAAVVSGVSIKKHWESEGSPWYNFFEEVPVEPFQRKDAEKLIRNPIRGIFKIEDAAVERILELTQCRPYLIQKLCVSVVKNMHDGKRSTVTVADVDAIERPGPDPAMEA